MRRESQELSYGTSRSFDALSRRLNQRANSKTSTRRFCVYSLSFGASGTLSGVVNGFVISSR